jgi:tetratricopeptide (TPR) repeat protein
MTAPHYHSHVDNAEAVGRRLKEARLAGGFSQRQLAFPGCSAAYISRLEAGERVPSLQLLRKLAVKLNADENFLATGAAAPLSPSDQLIEADIALRLDDLDLAGELFERILQTSSVVRIRAEALGGLGRLSLRRGDARAAVDAIQEALRIAPELEVAAPGLIETLARAYAVMGELESALGLLEGAADRADERSDAAAATRLRILLANGHIDSGSFGRAQELLGRALAATEDLIDPTERTRVLWSQSRLHALKGNHELAARFARQTLGLLELGEDTYSLARAHQLLAYIEVERGDAPTALAAVEQGLALLGTAVSPVEIGKFRLEEARALALLGRDEEAGSAALEAKSLFADAEPGDAARAFTVVGDVFERIGQTERAREIWELALEALEHEPNPWVADVYERLARLLEQAGKTEEALSLLKRALAARERAPR